MAKPESESFDRRFFLKVATGGVAALAAGGTFATMPALGVSGPAAAASGAPDRLRIDVHAHIYPPGYLDMLDRMGGGPIGTRAVRRFPASGNPEDLESRFHTMDRAGVKMQVISPAPEFPYFPKKEDAVAAAKFINNSYAEFVRRYPGRFASYVVTPLPHVDESIQEMNRGLDELGMVGVVMGTSVLTQSVADPMFDPLWEEMNRRGVILFFHPPGLGACSPLLREKRLTWAVGAPVEDTVVAAHLIANQIPKRYPRVRIIIPHLGGDTGMLMGRLDVQRKAFMPSGAELPSVTAKRFWYDTVSHSYPPALRLACTSFGVEKMVLGSDYPLEIGNSYQRCVDYVADAGVGLTSDEIVMILDRNAQGLFHLVPHPRV